MVFTSTDQTLPHAELNHTSINAARVYAPYHICILRRVREIAKSDNSFISVRPPAWNNSAPTGRIFMRFDIWPFFENLWRKIQVSLKSNKNNGYFNK
jgi:hypothetical protein